MGRPSKDASRKRKLLLEESENSRKERLEKNKKRSRLVRSQESSDDRKERLSRMRKYVNDRLSKAHKEDHEYRLRQIRQRISNESEEQRGRRIKLIKKRLTNESEEQRNHRLGLIRKRISRESKEERSHRLGLIRNRISVESEEQYNRRLGLIRKRISSESEEQHAHRISLIRERLSSENEDQRAHRLGLIQKRLSNESDEQYANRLNKIKGRISNESVEQRTHRFNVIQKRISNENEEQRAHRLGLIRERLSNETDNVHSQRLNACRTRSSLRVQNETSDQRVNRLCSMRQAARDRRNISHIECFRKGIDVYADISCSICMKCLYPQQRVKLQTANLGAILPQNLVELGNVVACSRCSNNLKKRKTPPQSYWNKMLLPAIPKEIDDLSEMEKRFLCRVVPFLKIIKVQNRFSQDWCKGQAILFAQDVVELAEQLPLQPNQAGLVLIVESRENLERSREFKINMDKLKIALRWLLANNSLYRDVRLYFPTIIDIAAITQIAEEEVCENVVQVAALPSNTTNRYIILNDNVSILHGSFHQGNERFSEESRGRQCTGIATVACAAFCLMDPNEWCKSDIDYVVLIGDKYYKDCIAARDNPDERESNVEYLAASELLPNITYNNCKVEIRICLDSVYNGHIDNDNSNEGFPNLINALISLFRNYSYGLLTTNNVTVAVHCRRMSERIVYWLFDSHARGPKGCKARGKGYSCCMRFNNCDSLHNILRRNLYIRGTSNNALTLNIYSLTPLEIMPQNRLQQHLASSTSQQSRNIYPVDILHSLHRSNNIEEPIVQLSSEVPRVKNILEPQILQNKSTESKFVCTTSMLRNIDEGVPNLDSIISIDNQNLEDEVQLQEVKRKTAPPLNFEREKRMEELGWYFLFPEGKDGFGEEREIPISPLDYFQARVMSSDKRFQRNDYLFFALSVVEYFRAKASVSVSCRMRKGQEDHTPQGLVDNMHLTMRNIRGSASYWRQCCSELIAMVRSLGPPTWFLTLSCNDLNWPDMIKALLIADGRNVNDVENVTFSERLQLVQKYPVVVSRQFTIRVNALMRYLRNNQDCLGGRLIDHWYRIEFQNRGSPHLHMLVWCENIPDFSTNDGIAVIERVISCSLCPDNIELQNVVKNVQIHRHTTTCYKDRNDHCCRFGFPRPPSEITLCLGPDEALANNGRFCILKRTSEETMVNNYSPDILSLWEGNVDIQPCGNITAVAYYVAKYASKCEPHDTGEVVRQAITRAKRRGGTVWSQLFAVSMAIISQRLVSAPECAYRLCHLPLKMSSRKAVFINSCMPNQRFRLLRFEGGDTTIYNNIFDRYVLRPDTLENISLAEFAVRYETITNTSWNEDDGDIELREPESGPLKYIRLRDNSRMRVRNKAAVLRTRYYTLNSNKDGYYYNLIVCHIPFRNENELLLEDETPETCFFRRRNELRPLLTNLSTEEFTHAEQVIQQALAHVTALNAVRETRHENSRGEETVCADECIVPDQDNYCEDMGEQSAMADDIFLNNIRGLNVQQKNLFQKISTAIEQDIGGEEDKLLLFITGGAGSGKSFVLKLLVEHIKRCYAPTIDTLLKPTFVEVGSLTGVAARQILGKTLHSLFSLPVEKGNSVPYRRIIGQKLEQERRKWRHINWLVIDEISMVSYENLRMIHLRLQEFKSNDKMFGGINIILFGDIMQLPPVKGHWCFAQPPWCVAEVNLWHAFSFCELTINMRQRNDVEFIDLLNNLRVGELTTAQLELLCERRRIAFNNEFQDGTVIRIFPTVKQVDKYNNEMTIKNSTNNRVYNICSIDESREIATYGKTPPDNVVPKDVNNCGGLLSEIKLASESRVMLRRNISLSDGLVNGTMGIVKKFKWPALRRDQLEDGELPECVLIKFDDETIGTRLKDSDGFVPVYPACATFQGTKGYGDIERRMLPLILSWAVTVHKLQGTTLDKAVIDLGKKVFAKGQVYVALSRVKTLEGIALSDLEPNKLLNKPHDERALAEMQRLRNL